MDELRERVNTALLVVAECRCADDGDGYTDVWLTNPEQMTDAVLAEIDKTHVLVESGLAHRLAVAAAASECFDERGRPCIEWDDWKTIEILAPVETR